MANIEAGIPTAVAITTLVATQHTERNQISTRCPKTPEGTEKKDKFSEREWNSQISHQTGAQFTTFPSHTIELTNHTREESPVQKINKHVPAFQLEASVRCQVRGTDTEVKANREKTVNT